MRGTRIFMRASAVLACLLIAGAAQAEVGGSVKGLDTNAIVCRNLTTGEQVVLPSNALHLPFELRELMARSAGQCPLKRQLFFEFLL